MAEKEAWKYPFTAEMLKAWKDAHGSIHCVKIADTYYVYKALTVGESKEMNMELLKFSRTIPTEVDDDERFLHVRNYEMAVSVKYCALWPEDTKDNIDKLPAGVLEQLNAAIYKASGYDDSEAELIEL